MRYVFDVVQLFISSPIYDFFDSFYNVIIEKEKISF